MSDYETLKHEYAHTEPEDRLRVLKAELQRPLITIQSVAALLKKAESNGLGDLPRHIRPEEFDHLVEWLRQASEDIEEILAALTADMEPEHKQA